MKMCAGDFTPPPYIVTRVVLDTAVLFDHKENDVWVELLQFVLVPQAEGTTRLITRTRANMVGSAWVVVNRIAFLMVRKMLLTIKSLLETGTR